ncbi:alkylmercury lyase family protein [Kribbella sp. NBC_00889]|uniref:alkylmercury lyase family protein n=1 Tax=Kribbella sp. NBC_00889 TaxID=2975974 RepID=UPI0038652719|nr:alkylmercury lyase family protein [Kribbella sp. NBC_00889]
MRLEVLHVPDCPNLLPLLERLAQVTDLPISTRMIESPADAERFGMAGSPTLLIDGQNPFAMGATPSLACRLSVPSTKQLREAVNSSGSPATEILSTWRRRAVPLDAVTRATHREVLRAFATTGAPPFGGTTEVLRALHELDAIRLTSDGEIAVAYPFSATPTRHRVRIADQVDVYAMCAVDALGIAPMLGQDTVIHSTDPTDGSGITVVRRADSAHWDPAGAVVFIGADPGGGPSADCCCDYLNFFATRAAAEAWTTAHPQVPGQIINQREAEDLAVRLFGQLLDE